MPRILNFSKPQLEIYNLAADLIRDDYSHHLGDNKVDKHSLENFLRKKINEDILGGLSFRQAMRIHGAVFYTIMEEILKVHVGENIINSPFIDNFVEVKRYDLGDKTYWYSEGGLLTMSTFAGNHWDTNRQALDLGSEFTLRPEWAYIHVYEELEQFLVGIGSLEKLMDAIRKATNKFFKERIYKQFQSVSSVVPAEFVKTGNTDAALGDLCDVLQAAGGYDSLTIAGTAGALRKLVNIVPDKTFADSQREALAQTGSVGTWEGKKLFVIPQALKSGTYDTALSNDEVFILGGETKPIKLGYYGDIRIDENTDGRGNNDQTIDIQVQTKFEIGMVLPPYFGKFVFV